MISFLYPLMWLAVPLVGVPLWLHLQRRNDSRTVRFSAMRFLDDQPLARRRPLLPRDLPLLLLRLLLILLIIAAFAWPYVAREDAAGIGESRVYILDNTLSNQAAERFEASRDQVADAIEAAGLETQIAVVQLTNEPRVVVQFGDDRQAAVRRLRELEPGYSRGSYAAAFRQADGLLRQALGTRRTIVLAGDSQQNQWEDDAAVSAFLKAPEVVLPETTPERLPNLAVRQPVAERVTDGIRSLVECSVRLFRQGETGSPSVRVRVNGTEVLNEPVQLDSASAEQTLLFQLPDRPDEWLRGEVAVHADGDSLKADNRAYFSVPPIEVGRVAVLSDSVYLRTALAQQVTAGQWESEVLSRETLAGHRPADVLCLDSRFLADRRVRELAWAYLAAGRGVALWIGGGNPAVNGLLRDFGIEWEADEQPEPASFRYVFTEHPIFQPFRSADAGNLSEILIKRYRRLRAETATPLVFSASGDPLLLDLTVGRGRLLAFAFEFDRSETNWPLHPSFLPFLDGCLRHVRRREEPWATDYLPGETCVWNLPAGFDSAAEHPLELSRHGGASSEKLSTVARDGTARFTMPRLPGHYDLRLAGDDAPRTVLNVNPPPEESLLTFGSASETLEGWRRTAADGEPAEAAPLALSDLTRQEILRQRIWWWLVAVALLATLVETAWVARSRSPSPVQESR